MGFPSCLGIVVQKGGLYLKCSPILGVFLGIADQNRGLNVKKWPYFGFYLNISLIDSFSYSNLHMK